MLVRYHSYVPSSTIPFFLLAVLTAAIVLTLAWVQAVLAPEEMTRDPLAVAQLRMNRGLFCCSPFLGAVSTLGVLLWAAGAALGVAGALILHRLRAGGAGIALLALGAALSLWLALDDGFMLHETYPVRALDVSLWKAVPALLLAAVAALIVAARAWAGWTLLGAAAAALAASLAVDEFAPQTADVIFVEDAFKFLGSCLWAAWFLYKTVDMAVAAAASVPAGRPDAGSVRPASPQPAE